MKFNKLFCLLIASCAIIFTAFALSSCSEETEDLSTTYIIGFMELQSSNMSEITTIADAYKAEIGVSDDEFELPGEDMAANDRLVKAGCERADAYLKTLTFSGYYVVRVQRGISFNFDAVYGTK